MRDRFFPQLDVEALLYSNDLDSLDHSGIDDQRALLRVWQKAVTRRYELETEIQRLRAQADARNIRPTERLPSVEEAGPSETPTSDDLSLPEMPYPDLSETERTLLERLEEALAERPVVKAGAPAGEIDLDTHLGPPPVTQQPRPPSPSPDAAIGTLPPFEYQGPVKRRFSRLVARIVLFFTRFLATQVRRSHEQLRAAIVRSHEQLWNTIVDLRHQREEVDRRLGRALADLNRRLDDQDTALHESMRQVDASLQLLATRASADLSHLRHLVEDLIRDLRAEQERLKEGLRNEVSDTVRPVAEELGRQFERIDGQQIRLLEIECLHATLEARLAWMRFAPDSPPAAEAVAGVAPLTPERRHRPSPTKADLDALYLDFENRFRGPRSLIRQRLEEYLPIVEECGAGTPERPILDLGCGRGEWLELLAEKRWTAHGVDSNQAAIHFCHQEGLAAELADALDHLRTLEGGSVGMVTLFHVVEHLPFTTLVSLLDEAHRVLAPGAILLIETPNPENLTVGAYTFHIDPTHLAPLVPDYLAFLVGRRGFDRVRIERLSRGDTQQLQALPLDDSRASVLNPLIECLNGLLATSRDYAVIGSKPTPRARSARAPRHRG